MHSQDASIVALLVHLVDDIFDKDFEVIRSMVINNVAHIRYENRLLHPVFQIHQKPKNRFGKQTNRKCLRDMTADKHTFHIIQLSL